MVLHGTAYKLAGFLNALREVFIGPGGLGISTGMMMGQDN